VQVLVTPLCLSMSLLFNRNKANKSGSEQLTGCRLARPVYPDSHLAVFSLFLSSLSLNSFEPSSLCTGPTSPFFHCFFYLLGLSLLKLILRGDVLGRKQRYLSAPNALKHVGSCTCPCLSSSPETEQ